MRGERGAGLSLELSAVGSAILRGLVLMLVGALILGGYDYMAPLTPAAQAGATWFVQALAVVATGFCSGRRAQGAGWLHGALAGMGLALAAATVTGVLTEFPSLVVLAKGMGLGGLLGALAGMVSVNLR